MKIYDLSVSIYTGMLKWPEDPGVSLTQAASMKNGDRYNVSLLTCGTHLGTHIDAPYHVTETGKRVDQLSLYELIGEALVVQMDADSITADELRMVDLRTYKRILFKTRNSEMLKTEAFNPEYVSLDYSAAELLVHHGVRVIGIDYLSIEAFESETHAVHKLLTGNDIIILESLDLSNVEPGAYFLIALPLKLKNCDGAPARVVLVEF
ncbi:MAG: cyclase family protein [Methanophagales archaeon ANME-1-THS]|nr:MAG: cyclase family protein [Methanophagales archaeon ANME-1-THS]